ncbi:hypothetical protein [Micromonospora sp. Llam0]|uniref:RCC1 domain-containing protein n=1 Tax=Micromonospora sp. Llam0 TaxID=2485143 RepID=UPI00131584D5|nr:hypothetical protein [Micromonospora sp. Llam0]
MVLVIGNTSGADAGARQAPDEIGGVTAIAAGWGHNLGLRPDGTVIAWGWNDSGQLGNGDRGWYQSETPVQVCAVGQTAPCTQFLTGVIAIVAGEYYSLALLRDRTVVGWGDNTAGQLGDGTTDIRTSPVRVCAVGQVAPCSQLLSGVRTLAAGESHSLAQLTNGAAVAWGSNYLGQLGDGTTTDRLTPVRVCAVGQVAPCSQFLTGVRSLAAGRLHSLAVVDSALALAWGRNYSGPLGDGTTIDRLTPVRVCAVGQVAPCSQFLNAVRAVAAGHGHSMALLGNGSVVTWGGNSGALGDGTTIRRLTPVRVCAAEQIAPCTQYLYGVRHIDAGSGYSLAQLSSGGVLAWGWNRWGQLGDGTYYLFRLTPTRVCAVVQVAPCTQYLSLIRAIAAGTDHNLALQVDYTVVSWGGNYYPEIRS